MSSEPDAATAAGPLAGLRVVELASEFGAYAGKLLADMGAEVILVEPPGGHRTRTYGPFVDDIAGPERSLWFWHYNTSKLGVTLDLDAASDRDVFRRLLAKAHIVIEAEPVGHLSAIGVDQDTMRAEYPSLIWASVTPFGRSNPRSAEQATDLTILAGGGPVWNCGYDDASLPPIRGDGGQAGHLGSIWAAIGVMVAVLARDASGTGQLVDVSMHAAANVTTEQATQYWLVAKTIVQRQTGRHASVRPTDPVIALDRDGHEVHTGFPPRSVKQLTSLLDWLDAVGLRNDFEGTAFIEIAIEAGGIDLSKLLEDPVTQECYRSARDALAFIASKITGYEFFVQGQERGLAVGVIRTADEAMTDPQMVARGFPTQVFQPQLGRDVIYPGAPITFGRSPSRIRSVAPSVGQHQSIL
jgi:crotonobetainyl-CoA:carnitine CoA-transferase CaiB-like acyl-CoA transferase